MQHMGSISTTAQFTAFCSSLSQYCDQQELKLRRASADITELRGRLEETEDLRRQLLQARDEKLASRRESESNVKRLNEECSRLSKELAAARTSFNAAEASKNRLKEELAKPVDDFIGSDIAALVKQFSLGATAGSAMTSDLEMNELRVSFGRVSKRVSKVEVAVEEVQDMCERACEHNDRLVAEGKKATLRVNELCVALKTCTKQRQQMLVQACELKNRVESLEYDLSRYEDRANVAENLVNQKNEEITKLREELATCERDFAERLQRVASEQMNTQQPGAVTKTKVHPVVMKSQSEINPVIQSEVFVKTPDETHISMRSSEEPNDRSHPPSPAHTMTDCQVPLPPPLAPVILLQPEGDAPLPNEGVHCIPSYTSMELD